MSRSSYSWRMVVPSCLFVSVLTSLVAPSAFAQRGSSAGSSYPNAFVVGETPSISLTPRPVDPPGSQTIDITAATLDQFNTQSNFGTTFDSTQPTPLQDVLGPDGSDLVTHPGYSGYGFIVNNKTGSDLKSFTLTFSTPAYIANINVDTYVRTNDLQQFVSAQEFPFTPIPTWDFQENSVINGLLRDWTIVFTEANGYTWGPTSNDKTKYPAFTILSNQFPVGSDIQFSYRPSLTDNAVPEPGTWGLLLGSAVSALGFAVRRRRRV